MNTQTSAENYLFTIYIKGGEITYKELTSILCKGMSGEESYKYSIYVLEHFCNRGYIEKVVDIEKGNMLARLTELGKKVAECWAIILSANVILRISRGTRILPNVA